MIDWKNLPLIQEIQNRKQFDQRLSIKSGLQGEQDDKIVFTMTVTYFDKGIIAILIRCSPIKAPEEIIAADMDFIDQIGLKEHLSAHELMD
jgi:cysteine desulfuration protein SufE